MSAGRNQQRREARGLWLTSAGASGANDAGGGVKEVSQQPRLCV